MNFRHVFFVGLCGAAFALLGAFLGSGSIARAADAARPQMAGHADSVVCEMARIGQSVQSICPFDYRLAPFGATPFTVELLSRAPLTAVVSFPNPIVTIASENGAVLASVSTAQWRLIAPDLVEVTGLLVNLSAHPIVGRAEVHAQVALPNEETPPVAAGGVY